MALIEPRAGALSDVGIVFIIDDTFDVGLELVGPIDDTNRLSGTTSGDTCVEGLLWVEAG